MISQSPSSISQTLESAFGAVQTVLPGLLVDSVTFDQNNLEWVVSVFYEPTMKNTITALYVSKTGAPPYPEFVKRTFHVSVNPCSRSSSVCCLNELAQDYIIGPFATNISQSVGVCSASTQQQKTNTLFDTAAAPYLVDHLLDAYPNSYVNRLSSDNVQLHINTYDLRDQIAMRTDIVGGYTMTFFVGMSYLTMLPTNAISTVSSQTRVVVTSTNTLTFSFTSEQDYTFLDYVSMSITQVSFCWSCYLVCIVI